MGLSFSRNKGVNAYIYTVNNLDGLFLLISLLNGNMKTNKIYALHRFLDWYNRYKNACFKKKGLNTHSILHSAWLSGFIEADGHFSLRSQRQKDQNKRDNLLFLDIIALSLGKTY
jgi:hypothetical protein